MRGRPRRLRAAIAAAEIPTWRAAAPPAAEAGALAFVPAPGRLPAGQRIYAIGDVHGEAARLSLLHAAIAADLRARPCASARIVHLGDFIDYGPDSAGVLAGLRAGSPVAGVPMIALCGDHERMLRDALEGDGAAATDWLHSGGAASLRSWGVPADTPREAWRASLPPWLPAFLRGLRLSHRAGDYVFVHAGIRPGIAIARQTSDDLLSIRQPFLADERDHGVIVVHGHSVAPSPRITNNRIGLDTGAGLGGPLTCAVLEDDRIGFLSA